MIFTVHLSGDVAAYALIYVRLSVLVVTGIVLRLWMPIPSVLAAPMTSKRFADWCQHPMRLQPSQRYTIAALLYAAKTANCEQAEAALLASPELNLQSQGVRDLSPLVTLPHLTSLNVTHNHIVDLSPLRQLPNLRFLLAGRNRIRDVSPLAKVTNLTYVVLDQNQIRDVSALKSLRRLTSLNLLNNPITPKTCPVTPANVCLFTDGAQDQFEAAEQQYQQGQFRVALRGFEQVLTAYEQAGDRHKQGDTLNRLGDSSLQLGQYPQALAFYQRSLKLRRAIADESGIVVSLTSLAGAYERLAVYEKAQDLLRQALGSLQQQNPFRLDGGGVYEHAREEALLYAWQARLFNQQGQHQRALTALDQAKRLFDNIPPAFPRKRFDERLMIETRGATYLALGCHQQAVAVLQRALQMAEEGRDRKGTASTLTLLARAYRQQGDERALKTFRAALAIQQAIADQPGAGLSLHEIGVTLLQTQAYAEASKALIQAIEIWESLRPGLTDANKVSLFETQARTYEHLQAALVAQNRAEEALEVAERGRARAFVELLAAQLGGEASTQLQQADPPTIGQIQEIARTQQATLVEYSLLPDQLLIWVITPDGLVSLRTVNLKDLPSQATVPQLIRQARRAMGVNGRAGIQAVVSRAAQREPPTQLRQLYQVLIEPIADLLPEDPQARVILIPHRDLFLVPFPALTGANGPLIQDHTLVSVPSIQLLHYTHQRRQQLPQAAGEALIVGNPEMPLVPLGVDQPAQPLSPLPGAEREAVAIATLLNTTALTGAAATETAVLDRMTTANTIHLATHGLLDELNHLGLAVPGAIALTPSSGSHSTDGLLTAAEILNLDLQAELVVLSACNTGIGTITGDGVIGLSRSLMAAGTPSVVVSLWAVPDAPTAALMTEFYAQLQRNPDKAQALRQAMLTTLEQHPDPRDWAAFTLMGQSF